MEIDFEIESRRYLVRSFKPTDKYSLVKYADNYNVFKTLRDRFPHPYTEEDADEWLRSVCYQNTEYAFAIANESELIGCIGLDPQQDVNRFSVEIGYWLAEPFWGKGIITKVLKIMVEYTFRNFTYNRIFAGVFENNKASEKVLRNAGFKLEAKLKKAVFKEGKFLDQYIYSLLREDVK